MLPVIKELGIKSVLSMLGQIAGYILSMCNLLLVTHFLGAEIYGTFVYLLSIYSVVVIFAKFGLGNTLISFLSRDFVAYEKKIIISVTLWVSLSLSIALILAGYLAIDFISDYILNAKYINVFLILLPYLLLEAWSHLLLEVLRSQRLIKENILGKMIIMPLVRIVLLSFCCFFSSMSAVWIYIISLYISYIVVILYALYHLGKHDLMPLFSKVPMELLKKILFFSSTVLMTDIVSVVMGSVDKYMLGEMAEISEVGVYNVALTFGGVSSFALTAVNNIFAPLISELYSKGYINELKMVYRKATKWITAINMLIFGIIIVFSKDIMHIAGEEFVVGSTALIIVGIGQIVNCAVGSVGYMNVMTGHPRYNMYSNVVAMIFNIIGNWCLIPVFGMNGAAISTAGALGIHNIINYAFMQTYLPINPIYKKYIGLLLAFIVATVCAYFSVELIEDYMYLHRLFVGAIIYLLFFCITLSVCFLDDDEKNIIIRPFSKG